VVRVSIGDRYGVGIVLSFELGWLYGIIALAILLPWGTHCMALEDGNVRNPMLL